MEPGGGGIDPAGGGNEPPGGGMEPAGGGTDPMGGGIDGTWPDGAGPPSGPMDGRLASATDDAATICASLAMPEPGSSSRSCTRSG